MKTYIRLIPILCMLLFLTACEEKKQAQQMPPMPVSVFTVTAQDTPWPAEYLAQTQGSRAVEVRARVQGIIEKRLYEEGHFVNKGQVLFQIEKDQYEAQMQQAAAQLDSASREWKRIQPLFAQNAVSQKDRDNAKAAYDSARAALRQAKVNLEYCTVISPVSGFTSKEHLSEGNLVSNSTLLTTVNQTDPMHVNFAIPGPERMQRQALAASGRLVQPEGGIYDAALTLQDGSAGPADGKVDFIDTQIDPDTGTVAARATFANAAGTLMPGQYARLRMSGDVLRNAVLIPQKCVLTTQQGTLVMIVTPDSKIQPCPVKIAFSIGDKYLIDGGLKGGERIVLEGLIKAMPGAAVRIVDPNAQKGAQQNAQQKSEKTEAGK